MLFTIIAYDEWGIMIFWGILALGFFSYVFFSKEIVSKNNKQKTKEEVKGKKETRVRVCSGCGATVNSNDDVCEFCGTKL